VKQALNRDMITDLSWRLWVCMLAIIALVGIVLYARGFSLWSVLAICIALVCPGVILWTLTVGGALDHGNSRPKSDHRRS